jgi:enoyl-CoA hydratase/carnithine racemase
MNTPTAPHTEGSVDAHVDGHILRIAINRPAKMNGFTPVMYEGMARAYTQLEDDPELRVGVLYAEGEHFTAGLDLPKFAEYMRQGKKAIPWGMVDATDLGTQGWRRRTKPVVVAVKGVTYTIGIEMLAADIVVAADNCKFSQLEVKRGIMATGGATLRFAERSGLGNAMLHLLTGDVFDAQEALRMNFVQKVVPAGQELEEALRIARQIAANAPLAVAATRQSVLKTIEHGTLAASSEFMAIQARLANSEDAKEGVQSFIERREANFKGR